MIAATRDFRSNVRVELMKSLSSRDEILERQLDVVEAGALERLRTRRRQADAGGDEVGVEAQAARMLDKLLEVVPQQRLASPRKPSCTAPSARASASTRFHVAVSSSWS